jgi:hypothetical protein
VKFELPHRLAKRFSGEAMERLWSLRRRIWENFRSKR